MTRYAAVAFCAFVLAGCAPAPCPEGKARDNDGQCVATANVFDQFDKPAPSKDEYIAQADDGMVLSDESIARINANNERQADEAADRYERRRAERRADERADRLVEAERETQAKLDRIGDKLD